MLDELVAWLSAPVVMATVTGAISRKWCSRAISLHLFVAALAVALYLWLRSRFANNVKDPFRDELDDRCMFGFFEGMRVLHYVPPEPPQRKILLLPGVSNSVRRMLRYDFVRPFLRSSAIVCVQPRGLGESDRSVHVSKATLLTDAMASVDLLLPFDLPVHVVGFSAGGFMAAQLCAAVEEPIFASLTLVGTMFTCEHMALDMKLPAVALRMFQKPLTQHIALPVLLMHSLHDQSIAIAEAEAHLAHRKALRLPVKMMTVLGKHSSYVVSRAQQRKLLRFVRFTESVARQALVENEIRSC